MVGKKRSKFPMVAMQKGSTRSSRCARLTHEDDLLDFSRSLLNLTQILINTAMMWTFAIRNKAKAALLLCVVLGLVMLTNLSERRNASKITEAITSIYEDRLVVEGYVFELSQGLNILELYSGGMLKADEQRDAGLESLKRMSDIITKYGATRLTPEEKKAFSHFSGLCNQMCKDMAAGNDTTLSELLPHAKEDLQKLSRIQLDVAQTQLNEVLSLTSFSAILSHFELAILIVIAVLIQMLIFSMRMLNPSSGSSKASLN